MRFFVLVFSLFLLNISPSLASVNIASGNLSHHQVLFSAGNGPLALEISLDYNSRNWLKGELGRGWTYNYEIYLFKNEDGSIALTGGAGRRLYFSDGNGGYKARTGDFSALQKNTDDSWTVTLSDGLKYHFNASLKLTSIVDAPAKSSLRRRGRNDGVSAVTGADCLRKLDQTV